MTSLFIVLALSFCLSSSSKSPPTLGIYDNFYSRSHWSWYKDSGSWAMLLKHNNIPGCYIAVNMEPWGYEEENWVFNDTIKAFGRTKYRVIRVSLDGDLWCYTYIPMDTSAMEQLNVYMDDSCKACLKAAEKVILNKEKSK